MQVAVKTMSATDYLLMERASTEKHEYFYENVFPMAGATQQHNIIGGNIFAAIWFKLKRTILVVFQNDMRVFNPTNNSYMYPDVVVSDGEPIISEDYKDNLLNPLIIIEVLSPSTAIHDKTDKFIACRSIKSLKEYVLVSTDMRHVEVYRREEDDYWVSETIVGNDATLHLTSIGFECPLEEIYDKV